MDYTFTRWFVIHLFLFLSLPVITSGTPEPDVFTASDELPGKVAFSSPPGFYSRNVSLVLSHPDNQAIIYYTLDGSVPTTSSLRYVSPIIIADRSEEENNHSMIPTNLITGWRGWLEPEGKVAKSTIIRAMAVKQGVNSQVSSGTWFVFPQGEDRYSLDVISIITGHDNLFSDATGIYVPGDTHRPGSPQTGNYAQRGIEWERPASIEFFGDDFTFQQDIGIRIHGGWTRRDPIKSLRLYARSDYGVSRFNYQIFPELPYTNYNRLLLRQSGNDFAVTLFRDAVAQSLVSHLDLDIMAYRPTIVFINGEYWGIKNLRERYDRHYLERVYGVDPDNIDLLTGQNEVTEGDNIHYNQMISFVTANDLSNDARFNQVARMMDINNYLDYYSAQVYYQNNDWPQNNIDYWRLKVDYDDRAPKGHDGRWRWMLYDVDRALGLLWDYDYRFNMIEYITNRFLEDGREWPNLLFRNLLENENFRHSFINRIADHLNTAFLPSRVLSEIDRFAQRIEPEIDEHTRRWRYPESKNEWESLVERLRTNAANRPEYVRKHVMEHFGIGKMVNISLSSESHEHGYIRINSIDITPATPGVPLDPYPWTGIYFQGIPVTLEAIAAEGYTFSHWTGTGTTGVNQNDRVLKITPEGDITLEAHFTFTGVPHLVSYWFFGTDLPNDTPLKMIPPTYGQITNTMIEFHSALEGYPYSEDHELWRTASLERRNAPTSINYRSEANNDISYEESGMRGIQVRQPLASGSRQSSLVFHLPTFGYSDILFRFAAMDEGAAKRLLVEYSVTSGDPVWTSSGLENHTLELTRFYQLFQVDLSSLEQVNNNPDFKIRLRFDAEDMNLSDGNRITFNNISLHAEQVQGVLIHATAGAGGRIEPAGITVISHGDNISYNIMADQGFLIRNVLVDGDPLPDAPENTSFEYTFTNVMDHRTIHADFTLGTTREVKIYPNPASDILWFEFLRDTEYATIVSLVNINGSLVSEKTFDNADNNVGYINLAGIAAGMYIVRIVNGPLKVNKKVIIF
jgi:uncharacterized repeat protein (TIGR02543 family)